MIHTNSQVDEAHGRGGSISTQAKSVDQLRSGGAGPSGGLMRPRRAPGREPKLPPQKHLRKYRQDPKKPETLASVSGMLNATSPSQEDALSVHRDAPRPGFHTIARRSDVSGETSGETRA